MTKRGCACILLFLLLSSMIDFSPWFTPKISAGAVISDAILNSLENEPFVPVIAVLQDNTDHEGGEGPTDNNNFFSANEKQLPPKCW